MIAATDLKFEATFFQSRFDCGIERAKKKLFYSIAKQECMGTKNENLYFGVGVKGLN